MCTWFVLTLRAVGRATPQRGGISEVQKSLVRGGPARRPKEAPRPGSSSTRAPTPIQRRSARGTVAATRSAPPSSAATASRIEAVFAGHEHFYDRREIEIIRYSSWAAAARRIGPPIRAPAASSPPARALSSPVQVRLPYQLGRVKDIARQGDRRLHAGGLLHPVQRSRWAASVLRRTSCRPPRRGGRGRLAPQAAPQAASSVGESGAAAEENPRR